MIILFRKVMCGIANALRYFKILHLKTGGVKVGNNTMISLGAKIDTHKGKIVIGDNCLITHGAKILSHDGALRLISPGAERGGSVAIGNNVFVGVNAIILKDVTVGDNSVIAAGAVVVKDVPTGVVVAGNPAKVIRILKGPFPILNSPG